MTTKNLPEKTPTLDLVSGAAGAWQRGYEAGQHSGHTLTAIFWATAGIVAGILLGGVLR